MRATVMYGAGDVRVEDVPDARLIEPTDALVRVRRAGICGSDLWPYKSMEPTESGRRMGHEFIGVVEAAGSDVETVKRGDLVLSPSCGRTAPASSARRVCRVSACTAAATASATSMAGRVRPYASRRQMARSSCCRSGWTTRLCRRCSRLLT